MSFTIISRGHGTIGGESLRIGEMPSSSYRQITPTAKLDMQLTVAGAETPTATTLWDAATSHISAFQLAVLVSDPDWARSSDQQIDVLVTNNAVESVWRLSRTIPLWLGPSAQTTGAITVIKVKALDDTDDANDANDIDVRFLVLE